MFYYILSKYFDITNSSSLFKKSEVSITNTANEKTPLILVFNVCNICTNIVCTMYIYSIRYLLYNKTRLSYTC